MVQWLAGWSNKFDEQPDSSDTKENRAVRQRWVRAGRYSLLAFGQLLGAGNGSNENDFVPGGHRIRPTIKWCLSGVSTSNRRYSNQQESNRANQPRPRPISRILSASKESEATTSWYLDVSWAQRLFQATLLQAKVAVSAVAFNPNSYLFFCPGPVETF